MSHFLCNCPGFCATPAAAARETDAIRITIWAISAFAELQHPVRGFRQDRLLCFRRDRPVSYTHRGFSSAWVRKSPVAEAVLSEIAWHHCPWGNQRPSIKYADSSETCQSWAWVPVAQLQTRNEGTEGFERYGDVSPV